FRQPSAIDQNKVNAQQARRILDRLVGYKVSPILWAAIYKGLSAGRVQSVALRLIVERDAEIEAFVPEEYWKIAARLLTGNKERFEAKVLKKDGEALAIKNEDEANGIVRDLSGRDFRVAGISTRKNRRNPYPPFITSTMQQEAAAKLHFNVSRTMSVAQTLYEGVDLDEGTTGLITYMRTDSTRIAPEAIAEVRSYIEDKWGGEHVPKKPNFYRAKKSAQDAHETIRPATMALPPEKVKKHLAADQFKLYQLIWNRFIASQMKPAEYNVVTVDIDAGPYGLKATASQLLYRGFLAVYEEAKREDAINDQELAELPKLSKGDGLDLEELVPTQHFTKPPYRYTEASLVRDLESQGIGRPSTYAQIINTILARKYVIREKGRLLSTELGRNVKTILINHFPDLFNVNFTAGMEEELDKVEAGENEWLNLVGEFYGPFSESLEQVRKHRKEIKKSLIEETDEVCEKCGSPMVIRWGRNGKFMACSAFPDCRNTKPIDDAEPESTDEVCEKCGSPMEVKRSKYGRFLACSNYPACKNTKPYSLGVSCPEEGCGGEIVEKSSKRGKVFYGCSRYPKCKFASWNKPVAVTCPSCGCPTVIESKRGDSYTCPRCKHRFQPESAEAVK
ncbi:MAG: type I DNA topoisomerase, partial [Candidatus Latescibacteria bacterium]|nr:type I DNA topoisomerase [Candidatus Latescibacterota bacterium]